MTQNEPKVAIIGCGRLGSALGIALHRKGYRIVELVDRLLISAERLATVVQAEKFSEKIEDIKTAEIVFVAVPDDTILPVAISLAAKVDEKSKMNYVYHTSGTLTSDVFDPLRKYHIAVASAHPIQTFPGSVDDWKRFENCYFGVEGDRAALARLDFIVKDLGSNSVVIPREFKSHYHLACTIASNFLVALMAPVTALFQKANFSEQQVFDMLFPLLATTITNLKDNGLEGALSGPILRGDVGTIERHLQLLSEDLPAYVSLYRSMGQILLEFDAVKKNLSKEQHEKLTHLLRTVN